MNFKILIRFNLTFAAVLCLLTLYGCPHYVGVEWVCDYSAVGKDSVTCRDDCAEGFYDTIGAHPDWQGKFNRGDADAWEEHFKRSSMGGTDSSWIDDVDFAYFAGHGAGAGYVDTGVGRGGGFTFGQYAHDDWVLAAIPGNREPRWGDGKLEWIVLDVCSALAFKSDGGGVLYTICQRWANSDVMNGLHYILGFRSAAHDRCSRGRIFAEYLTGARDGTKYTIREAWRKATDDTESDYYDEDDDRYYPVVGAYLRASSSGSNTYNDHLYGCGSVSSDPDPSSQCFCYCSWSCL
jgi:hypothetical protein